jgi:hypothetical protein
MKYIVIGLFVLITIITVIIGSYVIKHDPENKNYESPIKDDTLLLNILDLITEDTFKDQLSNMLTKDLFIESCKETLLDIINKKINNNEYHYLNLSSKKIKSLSEEIINNSKEVNETLEELFINQINRNVSDAIEEDRKHIEYLKTFGEDPTTDPELHPKDNVDNIEEDDIIDISVEDIEDTGTVEDI